MNLSVVEGLLRNTKVQVDKASNGANALELCKANKYDIILMDHMMPEPDGIATLHMIREDKDNPNKETPVIMLTANAIEGVKEGRIKEYGYPGNCSHCQCGFRSTGDVSERRFCGLYVQTNSG